MSNEMSINGRTIAAGERVTIELPITKLYTHSNISIPVHIVNGVKSGPRLFISAAIHGDELNGVMVIRRLLANKNLHKLRGTLIAVPVVNVHGFIYQSRYLPDRRDLNRSFPGSERGSLAARLAFLFMKEIVAQCTHGIDLHTGAIHRTNLPQVRADLEDEETARLARAFAVPVLLNSNIRDGSLREAAANLGIPMLLYEAGEALRFDEIAIRAGERGILNVMRALEMLPGKRMVKSPLKEPLVARSSRWIRAPMSGIFVTRTSLGSMVEADAVLGRISDPFGENEVEVSSPFQGIIIGKSNLPLVNEGDALVHVARFGNEEDAAEQVEEFHAYYDPTLTDD
jgi:predicted deacylase